jgi:hypothetical protein
MDKWKREEFFFCYEVLKNLWKARTPSEIAIAKRDLFKVRALYRNMNP